MKILNRYKIRTRHGIKFFTNKAKAISAAKDEQKDGWPSWVQDVWTEKLIWK